jgi:DNA-nicking Smr family endonuclease
MKKPSENDELFEKEMAGVRRLHHNVKVVERVKQHGSAHREISVPAKHDSLNFLRPGQQQSTLRKLRRSHISSAATLDLHGFNTTQARHALSEFVRQSQLQGRKAIRVIHGKGHGSAGSQPVLKVKVREWLQANPAVFAFCSASAEHGGTGAVDVLLK